jgi:hypothetical protein
MYEWFINGLSVQTSSSLTYSYIPSDGDQIAVILTSSEQCQSGSPASSNLITMSLNTSITPAVSIDALPNPGFVGQPMTFTASPVNGGTTPSFQWKINGNNAGTNNAVFVIAPDYQDEITCEMTSSEGCAIGNPAISNTIVAEFVTAPVTMLPELDGCLGETLDIPVTVDNFNNIGAVSLTLTYEPSVLTFSGVTNNAGFPLLFGGSTPGIFTAGGYSDEGISYPDQTVLFTIHFMYTGGNTALAWSDNGSSCEYQDAEDNTLFDLPFASFYQNGNVTELFEVESPVFADGEFSSRCQQEDVYIYEATASNATSLTYSLDPASITGGNLINSSTGEVTWNAGWTGISIITVYADGCKPKSATHTVTVHPTPQATITITDPIVCFNGLATVTITATGGTGILNYTFDGVTQSGNGVFTGIPGGSEYEWSVEDENLCGVSGDIDIDEPEINPVSGKVVYNNTAKTPLINVTVLFKQGGITKYEVQTTYGGNYSLENVCPGEYDLEFMYIAPVGGVNATDAGAVNYYGLFPSMIERVTYHSGDFTAPFNKINSQDASSILAYFLNLYDPTFVSERGRWTFWLQDQPIQQVNEPLLYPTPGPSPEILHVTIHQGEGTMNFYGLVTGDFNRSFAPWTPAKDLAINMNIEAGETKPLEPGKETGLILRAGATMEVGSISLMLEYPVELIEIKQITLLRDQQPVMYTITGNELRIGWTSVKPLYLTNGDGIFEITILAKTGIHIMEAGFSMVDNPLNELADGTGTVIGNALVTLDRIAGKHVNPNGSDPGSILVSCQPNPFKLATKLELVTPSDGFVTVELLDITGKPVLTPIYDVWLTAGEHQLAISGDELASGLYITMVTVRTAGGTFTKTLKLLKN